MTDYRTPEQKKATRRLARLKKGQWVKNMTEDEYALYVSNCEILGLGTKPRDAQVQHRSPDRPDNVVTLHPVGVDVGGIIPAPGASGKRGDHRKRYNMKYAGRLGKRWSQIIQEIKDGEYTWDQFVATLSPEELARGQIKDKEGGFKGRPPEFVPKPFFDACIRELLSRGRMLYKENYLSAIQAMTSIANNTAVKEADRIKAAQFVIERLEGKVPERLEIGVMDPWEQIISGIVSEADPEAIANAQSYLNRMDSGAEGN